MEGPLRKTAFLDLSGSPGARTGHGARHLIPTISLDYGVVHRAFRR
jgi:hypothetical protein